MIMIIQLTPTSGLFSYRLHQVLRLPKLPTKLSKTIYFYNNCDITFLTMFYPNPPCQLSLWEETRAPGENPRLSAERWQTLFTWVHSESRTHDLRGERRSFSCSDDCARDTFEPWNWDVWEASPYILYDIHSNVLILQLS